MRHIMVDLETLGIRPGCKVLSIGAVEFNEAHVTKHEFYVEVKREEQGGLHESQDTLRWWATQPADVRDRLFEDRPDKLRLRDALVKFNTWLNGFGTPKNICVWGNGADFDNPILTLAYDEMIHKPAWGTWNNRCYRTLKSLAPDVKIERIGSHHNALDDARSQAHHAVKIIQHLGLEV